MMNWLRSLLIAWRDRPDKAWKPTGLRFTTGRDYRQDLAIKAARKARTQSEAGRTYRRPAKPRKQPSNVYVLPTRRKEQA